VNEITENIIENYEKKLIDKIINTHYFYFLNYEKTKIIEKALQRLEQNEDDAGQLRVDIIREKLEEYFEDKQIATGPNEHPWSFQADGSVNPLDGFQKSYIEGFVRFRLREYYSVLEIVVDDAAQEYLIEREYEEFIGLLKYFLEISECKMPLLHIVSNEVGYSFIDSTRRDITAECMADFLTPIDDARNWGAANSASPLNELHKKTYKEVGVRRSPIFVAKEQLNYDDMLISTLLMLAPAKIFWYNANENSEIADTVKKIFEEKLSFINCNDESLLYRKF